MACIHFKFKNSLDYDSITFDGLHIALADLKRAIMNRKKLRDTDDDLQIINAITKKAYSNEEEMIPKNSSVIVARIPVTNAAPRNGPKTLNHPNAYKEDPKPVKKPPVEIQVSKAPDLSEMSNLVNAKGTEEEKIKAMIFQSTKEFDPSNYVTGTKRVPVGNPSPTYICKKCGKSGHFIQNCPVDPGEAIDKDKIAKRPTGIPHSFLTVTDDPNAKGALYLSPGQYGVPTIDKEAYEMKKKERPPFLPDDEKQPEPKKEEIPSELLCPICKDLLTDAVLIPCCGSSFCDECIRDLLLESEDQKCPQCHETDNSPDRLIANKSLRSAVMNFQNETGYTKITKSMKQAHEKRLAEKKLEEKKLAEEKRQAAKSMTQEKNGTATSSENMGKIRSIPTYQQTHDGKHHRQWSPSKYKPRREDAPAVVSKHDAQPALPNLTVTTATSSVPGGMSPPTPCKDEKEQQPLEKSSNSLVPMSQPPVSSQSSGQPILSTLPNAIRPSVPPPQPLPSIRPAVIPVSFPPAAPIQTIGIQYRPQVPMVNPAIPPPFPGPPPPGVFGPGPRYPPPGPPYPVAPPVRPLTKEEFYRTQKKLQEKEIKKKKSDPLDDFARELMEYSRDQKKRQPVKSSSRSRSKSRSRTPAKRSLSPRNRSRTRSRSFTPRKRSYTPRSRTRSRSRSRSRSPYGKGPYKSRSRTRSPRYRSRSRSRSFTPRFRSRSPRPRTYSRSPPPRYRSRSRSPLPRWRSRSRTPVRYDRWTPPPYGARRRSRSPVPYYRGRSRSPLPPPYDYYKPEWEQPPYHDYHDYRGKGRRGRGGPPAYPYPPDSYRFDPRAYDEFSQEFVQRYGILPPPPVMVAQHQHPYEAPPYRGPRRSRSPRDKRLPKDRPPRKTRDDKKPKSPTKTGDKKTEKKTTSKSSDKKDEKKKVEKKGASEKTADSKKKEVKSDKVKKEKVEKQKQKKVVKTEKKEESEVAVKEEKVVKNEDVKNDGGKEKEEDTEKIQNPDVKVKVEDVKVENVGVDQEKSDTQDKVEEKVGSQKEDKVKIKKKGKPKKLGGSRVNSEVESSQGESEKERKPKRKHKKISKGLVKGEAVVNDNEADESPAKRMKTEEPSVTDGRDDQLMLSPPILSKWEKEDSNEDVSPRRSRRHSPEMHGSVKDRKMLPRSVIERAEKALSQKQPQPISVASSVKSISNVAARLEKSPPIIRSPEGSAKMRRVTMDNNESSATKRVEEDSRKVFSRDRSMQIIVSSDNKERSKGKEKEVKDLRVSLMEKREKRASERERTLSSEDSNWDTYKKSYGHDTRDFDYSRDKDWDNPKDNWDENGWLPGKSKENRMSKVKTSKSVSVEKDERSQGRQKIEKDVSKETRKQEEMELSKIRKQHSKSYEKKEDKSDRKVERKEGKRLEERLPKCEESKKGDEKVASDKSKNVEDKVLKADEKVKKDNRTVVSKEEKGRVEAGTSNKSEKPKAQERNDRKESVIDESSFEPDYNEAMGSESEDEKKQVLKRQYSTAESEKVESDKADSESEEESDDKKHKKKKSKHKKHKKNKKKHKKKHKKQKDEDDSS